MIFLQINNFQPEGESDFKGLNVPQIKPGSQVFDAESDTYYVKYLGDLVEHEDVVEITETVYTEKEEQIKNTLPLSTEEEIANLKAENKQQKSDMDSAIMELTMLIAIGGTA